MSTFIMFGKYTPDGFNNMSQERTKKIMNIIKKHTGEINKMYAILGEYDLVFLVDFPNTKVAMQASVALSKYSGINFTTSPALPVEMFDELIGGGFFSDWESPQS
ncbi:MAG TPA: GYD domain-containing protein [Candidatus Marinimicrobia bacterium]|nr:GYD domain-containing protein [Candidatus Neomarinimicrobiota bacterium]MDP6261906.1 GYD domain-containing protein [Candidatus Neomarinimicrobiota bacterium]MDP7128732.1 GYD domain-containing protein [Candidatus Neomarinimicrobiota bacterium]MDP7337451.1 GYD domain-containing protein [Candidatus Neomarinimicrobiota bacterium]MDP7475013.1 GYD domain-containing protein [Candidatus Neomarinimicrobiota bacterium]